jgi:hypothetical protein
MQNNEFFSKGLRTDSTHFLAFCVLSARLTAFFGTEHAILFNV